MQIFNKIVNWFCFSSSTSVTWHGIATAERVTTVAWWTGAYRTVVHHFAVGQVSASAGTRVSAFAHQARLGQRTFRANDALRSTRWRRSDHGRLARAHGVPFDSATNAVRAARRWIARVSRRHV